MSLKNNSRYYKYCGYYDKNRCNIFFLSLILRSKSQDKGLDNYFRQSVSL